MIPAETIEGFRLSPQQERLWTLQPSGLDLPYRAQCELRLEGDLDPALLRTALHTVVRRYEILRTRFSHLSGLSFPVQVIGDDENVSWTLHDLRGLPASERDAAIEDLFQREALRPFRCDVDLPLRAVLTRLSAREHALLLALPALCADSASLTILSREIVDSYAAHVRGESAGAAGDPMQYADLAEWLHGLISSEGARDGWAPWARRGGLLLRPTALPFERLATGELPFAPVTVSTPLDSHRTSVVGIAAAALGSSPGAFLLAAWQALLGRLCGERELTVGVAFQGRDFAGLETAIGPLARNLPLVSTVEDGLRFSDLLRRTDEALGELGRWQEYFSWEKLAGPGAANLPFAALGFEFDPTPANYASGPLASRMVRREVWADGFALKLSCRRAVEGFELALAYDSSRFIRQDAARLASSLLALVEGAARSPETLVGDLPLLSIAERHRLLVERNDSGAAYPEGGCLHDLFEEQIRRTPAAVALVCEAESLSYAELDGRADHLAELLRRLGVGPDVLVGLCVERSFEMAVGLLGILKAGGAYVPLDPEYPRERLAFLLEDIHPPVLLTQERLLDALPPTSARIVCLDQTWELPPGDASSVRREPAPENAAYVIYTSGSTGRPKGAVISHRAIWNHMHWMQTTFPLGAGDAVVQKTPFGFDASVWEFHAPWMVGARLVMAKPGAHKEPADLLDLIGRQRVTTLQVVPSLLRMLVEETRLAGCTGLARLYCGGEALPPDLADRFLARSNAVLLNVYGPAEAAIHATCSVVTRGRPEGVVAIGRPIGNAQVYVADRTLELLPDGLPGELLVSGAGLGRGYWGRPGLTAERFVPDPWSLEPGGRMYRTGDLARWLPWGELEFLGRIDHQVKVRGHRVELGEIEQVLRGHGGVREAVVVVHEKAVGDVRLVAYLVLTEGGGEGPGVRELREYVSRHLPEPMVPSAFVRLSQLPLSPNGKVDRRALGQRELSEEERPWSSARTPVEEIVAAIWSEVLRLERVGVEESFFDLGGHSLLATQVVSRVRESFGVELALRSLFESPTVSALSGRVESALRSGELVAVPPLERVSREGELALSFSQERLWFLWQLAPESGFYNVPGAVRLVGGLEVAALERTLREVVGRHEVLRTVFVEQGGRPRPWIASSWRVELPVVDLSGLPIERLEGWALAEARGESQRPFDLSRGPLLRPVLLRLGSADHVVLFTLHHIVSDAWSLGVLVREVTALYGAFARGVSSPLPELEIQYADYAQWQRRWLQGEVLEGQLAYWRQQMAGAPPVLELPADRPRPRVQSFRGEHLGFAVEESVSAGVRELARAEGATLSMVLLAVFSSLLGRIAGQEEVVVGMPIAGRTRRETEELIGFFTNTLALRQELSGAPTLRRLVGRTREVSLGAYTHQDLPFEMLVEALSPERDLGHTPVFQVLFTLQNAPREALAMAGLEVRGFAVESGAAKFDLTLALGESAGRLGGVLEYNVDLFDRSTAERLVGGFLRLLSGAVAQPEEALVGVPLLAAAERRQVIEEWGRGEAEPSGVEPLLQRLGQQAGRRPAAPAVIWEGGELSYGELLAGAAHLGEHLRGLGVGAESVVGVCLERSAEMVVAVLGILQAGGTYLPLDPSYPAERLAYMVEDSGARWVVGRGASAARLAAAGVELVAPDPPGSALAGPAAAEPAAESLAYIIYTSGSTGHPKGVMVPHRALSSRMATMAEVYGLGAQDRMLQYVPLSFDAAVEEIFAPLWAGAAIVLHPDPAGVPALDLLAACSRLGVTVLHLPPRSWRGLLDGLVASGGRVPAAVRLCVTGGESLPPEGISAWMERASEGLRFLNAYGPSEITVTATVFEVARQEAAELWRVPIGGPVAGVRLLVVDGRGEPVPVGVAGELWIGGLGVARGYRGRPELTAERFTPEPCGPQPGARVYRTGDLVRWRDGGRLEFLGRVDGQLKLRGLRIEPEEIEAVLGRHPGVREAAVAVHEERSGEARLVGYVVGSEEPADGRDLAAHAARELPRAMVPTGWVFVERLPRTPAGKVDRRALAAWQGPQRQSPEEDPPATPVEELLAGIWAAVLGSERIGRQESFFDLGGHSLLATQVMSRLRDALGVELPLRTLFEAPVLSELAACAERALAAGHDIAAPPLRPVPRDGAMPLSFAQQRLWFLDQLEPGSWVFNIPAMVRLSGLLDTAALQEAFTEVVRRHEALRTTFAAPDGRPVQVVASPSPVPLPLVDLAGLTAQRREAEASRLAAEEAIRPGDLARGPLLRATVVALDTAEHLLLTTVHHIVADGWSMGILLRDVGALYAAFAEGRPSPLPELPIQYADYAVWQREWLQGEVLERQLAYWRDRLAGAPAVLELPIDRPRPAVQTYVGAREPFSIPRQLAEQLALLCRRRSATLFMGLLAGFQALLSRLSGQLDISIGTLTAGRTRSEVEGLIGFFLNTLVLRTELGGEPSFRVLLARSRESTLGAHAHQDLPFEKLVEAIQPERNLSHTPLFQVLLVLQNLPQRPVQLTNLRLTPVRTESQAAIFDLSLALEETSRGITGSLQYNRDLFDRATVRRMGGQLLVLLQGLVADSDRSIHEVALLETAEREQLVREWNDTAAGFPLEHTADRLFADQAARTPDAVAVSCGERRLSYRELDRRAMDVAQHLGRLGIGPESLVALFLERSPEVIVAILGIFRAGAAYLPLDPSHPAARQTQVLHQASPRLALTTADLAPSLARALEPLPEAARPQPVRIEEIPRAGEPEVEATGRPGNLAYVIYTSGSTGVPKGVLIEQRGMVNHLWAKIGDLGLDSIERVAQTASLCFDISVWQLLAALVVGGEVCVIPDAAAHDGRRLLEEVARGGISVVEVVPSLLRAALDEIGETGLHALTRLRWMMVTGEALPVDVARRWLETFPGIPLLNAYGPTECSDDVAHAVLMEPPLPGVATVSIGRAVANLRLYVLDGALEPLPIGVAGELYVGGVGVGRGYHRDPARTADVFVPDPFARRGARLYRTGDLARHLPDGRLDFLGRVDQQVKVRGFRIEPGEIENLLAGYPGIRDVAILARVQPSGEPLLVAYLVSERGTDLRQAAVRSFARERLPEYMVPAVFVMLDELPLTAHGKLDRRALLARALPVFAEAGGWSAPRTPAEELLAGLWAEVLRCERVGRDDDFFDLGGHSLLATRLLSRVRQIFKIEIPLRDLFEAPTVRMFAERIEAAVRGASGRLAPPIERLPRDVDLPLSFAQQRLWFLDRLDPGNPVYNVPLALRLRGHLDIPALARTLAEVVRRHEVLRTVFKSRAGRPLQVIAPPVPVPLPAIDLGALPAEARETELVRLATAEALRPFDLEHGPLLRAQLLPLAGGPDREEHAVLCTMHHIVSDGWSVDILVREVAALYRAFAAGEPSPLADLPIQYADFAGWQRAWLGYGGERDRQLAYWTGQLAGAPASLGLLTDRPRPPIQTFQGAAESLFLPEDLVRGLKGVSRREGVTLFMILLAIFQALLHRLTGDEDIVVGTPIAGRNHGETEPLLGFLVNTLVLRTDLGGDPTFRELLRRVRGTALEAYAHQDVPFEEVVDALQPERSLDRSPLFQVVLAFQNVLTSAALNLPDLSLVPFAVESGTAKFDLALLVSERAGGLALRLEYSTDLFERGSILRILRKFEALARGVVEDADLRLSDYRLLAAEEMRGYVPSDFPEAGLTQSELENLMEELGRFSGIE